MQAVLQIVELFMGQGLGSVSFESELYSLFGNHDFPQEAINAIGENVGRVTGTAVPMWAPHLVAIGANVSAFLIYLPSVVRGFPVLTNRGIPIDFHVGRRQIRIILMPGGPGNNRILGTGIQVQRNGFNTINEQIWRVEYHPLGEAPRNGERTIGPPWWHPGAEGPFYFLVKRPTGG